MIKFLARIVTVLSFLCFYYFCCRVYYYFYLEPVLIFHPLCNVIIVVRTNLPVAIKFTSGSIQDTTPPNTSITVKKLRNLHSFKTMDIWSTKTMLDILIWILFNSMQYYIKQISNNIPWIVSCLNVSRYLSTLLISNYKLEITTVPQIYL